MKRARCFGRDFGRGAYTSMTAARVEVHTAVSDRKVAVVSRAVNYVGALAQVITTAGFMGTKGADTANILVGILVARASLARSGAGAIAAAIGVIIAKRAPWVFTSHPDARRRGRRKDVFHLTIARREHFTSGSMNQRKPAPSARLIGSRRRQGTKNRARHVLHTMLRSRKGRRHARCTTPIMGWSAQTLAVTVSDLFKAAPIDDPVILTKIIMLGAEAVELGSS